MNIIDLTFGEVTFIGKGKILNFQPKYIHRYRTNFKSLLRSKKLLKCTIIKT